MTQTSLVASGRFEAARQLAFHPDHRTFGKHGHSFLACVECDPASLPADFPGQRVNRLGRYLGQAIALLDYTDLNRHLANPGDVQLAAWLRTQPGLDEVRRVAIQSTQDQGVQLDRDHTLHCWRRYRFQAAHQLPNVPPGHKCGRMHGHGFQVVLYTSVGISDPLPDAIPAYELMDRRWQGLSDRLDHRCLNEIEGLDNPTSENLSAWIWAQLKPGLPALSGVAVYETGSCGAHYDGAHYRIWKDVTLDSAVRMQRVPGDSPLGRLHGHTFMLRLHLQAALDTIKGWTIDFGDVKTLFDPIFKTLDHQPLYELPGLADADTPTLAQWVYDATRARLPQLVAVDLHETPGCGARITRHAATLALPG